MGLTRRGRKLLFDWAFRGAGRPSSFYVALVTAAPDPATETMTELTEIGEGNGYDAGGFELTPDAAGFDAQSSSVDPDYVDQQLADVSWAASGGNIPVSGGGAAAAVLTTDEPAVAARQIIAGWNLDNAPITVPAGLGLTLVDAFMRLGGDLSDSPNIEFDSGTATIPGADGAWKEIIASTSGKSTHLQIALRNVFSLTGAPVNRILRIDIGTGDAASEAVKLTDVLGSYHDSSGRYDGGHATIPYELPAGTRIAVRPTGGVAIGASTRSAEVSISVLGRN